MGIKTIPQPPNSPDLAPCDFWLFPKLRGCRYGTIEKMKEAVTKVIDTRGLPWGLPEVVGTVQQGHCSRRRLLRRGLEFQVCTINESAHTKEVWKLIVCPSYMCTHTHTHTQSTKHVPVQVLFIFLKFPLKLANCRIFKKILVFKNRSRKVSLKKNIFSQNS